MDQARHELRPWQLGLDAGSGSRIAGLIADLQTEPDEESPRIEGYEVHDLLGSGASGRVYLAVRAGSSRPVALKIFNAPLDGGTAAQRAIRELDILTGLYRPSIVRVLDYGVQGGRLWVATEHIDGAPVDRYCSERSLSLRERVALLATVCDAVQDLHESGVIHRDLKPSNIIVDESGRPVIIDLGLGSLIEGGGDGTLTEEGVPIGTPAFMSPEQARGERGATSTRSDVFALGAIGYLLLSGDTPHGTEASLHELIRRVAQDEPRNLHALDAEVPRSLAGVLWKAVRRNPEARYGSAFELGEDLRRWLSGEPVTAVKAGHWIRASRWIGRHPAYSTGGVCVAVIALTVLAAFAATWRISRSPSHVVVDSDRGRWSRVVAVNSGTLREWRSESNNGVLVTRVARRHPALGGGRVVLTVIRDIDGPADLDGQLCVWSLRNPHRLLWRTSGDPSYVRAPRHVALPPETSEHFLSSPESYGVSEHLLIEDIFAESPGDEAVVVHSHNRFDPQAIRVYTLDGKVLYEAWHWGAVGGLAWLAESRVLVFAARDNVARTTIPERPALSFPRAFVGISPQLGRRLDWINGPGADERVDVRFYKYLSPWDVESTLDVDLGQPADVSMRRSHFEIVLTLRQAEHRVRDAVMFIMFDAWGERASTIPAVSGLSRQIDELPNHELIRLVDQPVLNRGEKN